MRACVLPSINWSSNQGGAGNDNLDSIDGVVNNDDLDGGTDTDTCTSDPDNDSAVNFPEEEDKEEQ